MERKGKVDDDVSSPARVVTGATDGDDVKDIVGDTVGDTVGDIVGGMYGDVDELSVGVEEVFHALAIFVGFTMKSPYSIEDSATFPEGKKG